MGPTRRDWGAAGGPWLCMYVSAVCGALGHSAAPRGTGGPAWRPAEPGLGAEPAGRDSPSWALDRRKGRYYRSALRGCYSSRGQRGGGALWPAAAEGRGDMAALRPGAGDGWFMVVSGW